METLWFVLVVFMLTMYVVLDGFDLGVGALHLLLARNEDEREQATASIGPGAAIPRPSTRSRSATESATSADTDAAMSAAILSVSPPLGVVWLCWATTVPNRSTTTQVMTARPPPSTKSLTSWAGGSSHSGSSCSSPTAVTRSSYHARTSAR